ncbi:signal peptidase I, partial [Candidatus Bathyarchaeota archaeon]|nr:signal peptidase I [Candidatus Bathyarchaeota archaeon]
SLAVQKLKNLWKNEYLQTALTVALILIIVFGLYFGTQAALGSEYPALAVASGSMLPTLNIGDLIIVQKINPAEINVGKLHGDILVFRNPKRPGELIVHRAIKIQPAGNYFMITTAGDASGGESDGFSPWNSSLLIGKVIARIPAIGNLPLLLHSEGNTYILFLALLVILIILTLPFGTREKEKPLKEEQKIKEKMVFSKISSRLFYYIIINIILLGLIIFSLWGSLPIWQPGATPQQATIYGMLSDVQFHKSFSMGEVYLSQGFLTYQINYEVEGGLRQGVPTFSWFQLFLIILVIYNTWELYNFLKMWKEINKEKEADV